MGHSPTTSMPLTDARPVRALRPAPAAPRTCRCPPFGFVWFNQWLLLEMNGYLVLAGHFSTMATS